MGTPRGRGIKGPTPPRVGVVVALRPARRLEGLGESTYRLQMTSGSGQVFSYFYSGGVVTRTTHVASSPPDWDAYPSYW